MAIIDRSTILIADDDAVIRGNLRMVLKGEGFTILEASDGVEAERLLAESSLSLVLLGHAHAGAGRHGTVAPAGGFMGRSCRLNRHHGAGWQCGGD